MSGSIRTHSYQVCFPSCHRMYEPRSFRFGNFSPTRLSATPWTGSSDFILRTPRCFGLRPEVGLFLLIPPLETLILTTTTPCFALYPSILALSSLDGFSSLSIVGPPQQHRPEEISPAFSWKTLCQVFPISDVQSKRVARLERSR